MELSPQHAYSPRMSDDIPDDLMPENDDDGPATEFAAKLMAIFSVLLLGVVGYAVVVGGQPLEAVMILAIIGIGHLIGAGVLYYQARDRKSDAA